MEALFVLPSSNDVDTAGETLGAGDGDDLLAHWIFLAPVAVNGNHLKG